jgi:hypothetical protein
MPIYRYIVTIETSDSDPNIAVVLRDEIDSNLESTILGYNLNHFTVEPVSPTFGQRLYPGQGFDSRYQS